MSVLSRYLDADVLSQVAGQSIEPRGLVMGNLAGAHQSPQSGFAVEFAGHREYVPGDDPRHIDWRVYFNREKLFVKQYQLETNFVCHLLLDVSASMNYGNDDQKKVNYAGRLAATLAYAIIRQNDKVSLMTFDTEVRGTVPPSNSMGQILRITQHLDDVNAQEKTDLGAALTAAAGRLGRRQVTMILSDLFTTNLDSLEDAIHRLRYLDHEVVLFQIMHHDEWTFELASLSRFVGLEGEAALLADPDDIRRGYLAALDDFNHELAEICERNRCERVPVDTQVNMGQMLADYLAGRKGGRTERRPV